MTKEIVIRNTANHVLAAIKTGVNNIARDEVGNGSKSVFICHPFERDLTLLNFKVERIFERDEDNSAPVSLGTVDGKAWAFWL